MLRNWGHPTTLDQLLGKKVTNEERKEIMDAYMIRPICGYETLAKDLIEDVYKFM